MTDLSPRLSLPFILPAQAQKHVTHNEAIDLLDLIVQLSVEGFDAVLPPAAPAEGQTWALGAAPVTLWAGRAHQLATWRGGVWRFVEPAEGWRAWGRAEAALRVYRDGEWRVPALAAVQDIPGIGVNTAHDMVNRLAVRAPATLLTHEGAGHQLKLNKAGSGDTASLLYQSGWSGRAEIGLAGDDDLHVKVSADGGTFREAMVVEAATAVTRIRCLAGQRLTLADGQAGVVVPPVAGGLVLVVLAGPEPRAGQSGIFAYACGAAPACMTLAAGPGMENLGTAALTGASPAPGHSAIAAGEGALHLANRSGGSADYSVTFIGGA